MVMAFGSVGPKRVAAQSHGYTWDSNLLPIISGLGLNLVEVILLLV